MHPRSKRSARKIAATFAVILFLFLIPATFCMPDSQAAEIEVRFENPPERGILVFRFYNSANAFGDLRKATKQVKLRVDRSNRYLFSDITPGEYALIVYHDANENGQLDENFIGIPTEPIAFSNRYQPKGPPSYSRARFVLEEGTKQQMQLKFYRALGHSGRIGLGIGIIIQTSPYKDSDEGVYQPIPAIAYYGERFQGLGPRIQIGLIGSGDLRIAATAEYRIGAYEEDDSDFLEGLGDREDTLMAGLAVEYELPEGVDLSASYAHDVLDRIGGGEARVKLSKSYQWRQFQFSPWVAVNWMSSGLSDYDFGVPEDKATTLRPAYSLDDIFSPELGINLFVEFLTDWWLILGSGIKLLDEEITDSPIVSKDYRINGFLAINYVF